MIAFLRGIAHTVGEGYVDVDVHGVGYRAFVAQKVADSLQSGQEVFLFTYQAVREDAILLYGFPTEDDRNWFELLIGVSGIGPKGALQILSGISGAEFAEAIYAEDVDTLCRLPGVGKKTAARLVVELKDKLEDMWRVSRTTSRKEVAASAATETSRVERDVIEALVSLGYNERQAAEQVRQVLSEAPSIAVEDALRLCLQRMSG